MSELERTLKWFAEAKPNPTEKDLSIQMGVHFEEVSEMVENISAHDPEARAKLQIAFDALKSLGDCMKNNPTHYYVRDENRSELLDALCDQVVTATGTAYMLGFKFNGAMQEVNDSNWSKFVDGKAILNEQGKIAKGPDYFKPNLIPYL